VIHIKIGKLYLEDNVFLAPMAGVTDKSYRTIIKEIGCGMMFTEMVSAKALIQDYRKTHQIISFEESHRPIGVQLFGNEPDTMALAAIKLSEEYAPEVIDINMGCPVPKIVSNNEGSALMKDEKLAHEIVQAIVESVDIPVTVKIRKGFNKDHVNAVDFAKSMQDAGASMVAVHGRTRDQYYQGKADWQIIKSVKEALDIPVVGNGDVFSVEDAKKMFEITNCDGIMVARGVQGNPFLIKRIIHFLKTGEIMPKPSLDERFSTMLNHLRQTVIDKGEYIAIREMRSHIAWYLKGLPNSAAVKNEVFYQTSEQGMIDIVNSYYKQLKNYDF
jgi:tRNA-dihydrouridine synthase B